MKMSKKKGIIVSGYFNPLHKGHIEYFNNAKELADELFVIKNNDHQRVLKGSKEFQKEEEGKKVACIEEIAFNKGYINSEELKMLAQTLRWSKSFKVFEER